MELLKPGGILLIGAPNFLGLNKYIMKRLCPATLSDHELFTMDIENWKSFQEKYSLKELFKNYIGGFEPRIYKYENKNTINRLINVFLHVLRVSTTDRFSFLRKFNSKYFSSYVIGVYRKEQ